MIMTEMKMKSKTSTDKFVAWVLDGIASGNAILGGDKLRALAGAKSASNQMEYMRQFGTSSPEGRSLYT